MIPYVLYFVSIDVCYIKRRPSDSFDSTFSLDRCNVKGASNCFLDNLLATYSGLGVPSWKR